MIDVGFNVYSDTPVDKDPDQWSPTLRRYHQLLWNKALPDGRHFNLSSQRRGAYLSCHMDGEDHFFSSDSIGHTYRYSKPVSAVICQVPECELDDFFAVASTIGAYTIFPARIVNRLPTINGARGMHPRIGDRFDLTLECIRLSYVGEPSPLHATLLRYKSFFDLFETFQGYVNFFLFDDLLTLDTGQVKFFLPNDGFSHSPYPQTIDEYRAYRDAASAFI